MERSRISEVMTAKQLRVEGRQGRAGVVKVIHVCFVVGNLMIIND